MAPNLTSGKFRVVSLINNSNPPVGVNLTRPAFQSVHLNGRVTTWAVEQEGDNTYRLSVGGYPYTGVVVNRVTASIHPEQNVEWIATYRRFQDAYTISAVNDESNGWTVSHPNEANSRIALRLLVIGISEPPHHLTSQLYRFEELEE
ncbi:hypothetical protein L210DRAFT_3509297 [Boletus edulis BED1]|uniref:Uncharacterized protein n=1 Tax=Boletus edulis BED1 TaxID=1328754 RepID=A0AAD4BFT1_BOLED|nr:hypothetical protein L210DRAFT_3509297 [Boletus edulis BED1]